MCYLNCGPSKSSLEYTRRQKPQNHSGCGCRGKAQTCSDPSFAISGSYLDNWEKKYGKVVTTVTLEQDDFGKKKQIVKKTLCEKIKKPRNYGCCNFVYKFST